MKSSPKLIAVIGPAQFQEDTYQLSIEVGRRLAERGYIVICGGRGGVMEGACYGAKQAGGTTIGILPGVDLREANQYVDIAIVTGLGEARNVIVVRSACAVIAVGGEFGTLTEIAFALKFGIPVVGLETWHISKGSEATQSIHYADNPTLAVEKAINLANDRLDLDQIR